MRERERVVSCVSEIRMDISVLGSRMRKNLEAYVGRHTYKVIEDILLRLD